MDKLDKYPASPVPVDAFLWADELPFTAFGHLGEGQLDARVFEQDVWWVDIRGQEHLIKEMTLDYLNNVIKHLFANVNHFHSHAVTRDSIERFLADNPLGPGPEDMEGYRAYLAAKVSPTKLEPGEWLFGTVLVQRMYEEIDSRGF